VLDAKAKTEKVLTTVVDESLLAVAWDKSSSRIAFGTSGGRLVVYTRKGKECYNVRKRLGGGSFNMTLLGCPRSLCMVPVHIPFKLRLRLMKTGSRLYRGARGTIVLQLPGLKRIGPSRY
jgi:hypothetical protein